jgi:hypothetical protein
MAITLGVTEVDQINVRITEITADGFVERHPNATQSFGVIIHNSSALFVELYQLELAVESVLCGVCDLSALCSDRENAADQSPVSKMPETGS